MNPQIDLTLQQSLILLKLRQLGFGASPERVEEGPILRSFYLKPHPDALLSKISGKEEEIAVGLGVESVRLIRDRGSVVVEVPRSDRQLIRFDSCLHQILGNASERMVLPILLGQSPRGEYLNADLADQPHMLIAGSTGSGKSIFTSQLICSLALYRTPAELSLYLVDTKNLDLVLFRDLDHVKDVITDVTELRLRLESLLKEVRRRNEKMSGIARNIREWNAMGLGERFRYIVLVIDELADVLATDASLRSAMENEEKKETSSIASLIQRITQISRAAGVHLVTATQRPSIKMPTGDSKVGFGDIKANLPARICFKLPTMADSRVVLDENGAEQLLGKGDFLYKLNGQDAPLRAHSAYVSMENIALILSQHNEIRRMYVPS